jgi:hypothetical protein
MSDDVVDAAAALAARGDDGPGNNEGDASGDSGSDAGSDGGADGPGTSVGAGGDDEDETGFRRRRPNKKKSRRRVSVAGAAAADGAAPKRKRAPAAPVPKRPTDRRGAIERYLDVGAEEASDDEISDEEEREALKKRPREEVSATRGLDSGKRAEAAFLPDFGNCISTVADEGCASCLCRSPRRIGGRMSAFVLKPTSSVSGLRRKRRSRSRPPSWRSDTCVRSSISDCLNGGGAAGWR